MRLFHVVLSANKQVGLYRNISATPNVWKVKTQMKSANVKLLTDKHVCSGATNMRFHKISFAISPKCKEKQKKSLPDSFFFR